MRERRERHWFNDSNKRKELLDSIPEVQPLSLKTGILIFGGITVVGLGIGAAIGTQIFFGTVTLGGLIALAESNKYVKYLIVKSNKTIDVLIFIASLYAVAALGVTVAGGLIFTGLGYTLVYAPYLRKRALNK